LHALHLDAGAIDEALLQFARIKTAGHKSMVTFEGAFFLDWGYVWGNGLRGSFGTVLEPSIGMQRTLDRCVVVVFHYSVKVIARGPKVVRLFGWLEAV
jgi:hypothetical protein